jgi:pimeloyl-ACP methyl ester carboxylesterase
MIETLEVALEGGQTLHCRCAGPADAPLLVFLHGFPEAAFVWDPLLAHFAGRYRCVAPNLRGYAPSFAPVPPEAYRIKHLVADLAGLLGHFARPPEALIAHDWGGAVAWAYAALPRATIKRLVIVNAPHPATFLRELQHNPAQRAASAYMNFLCDPQAERLLAENDHARLWAVFTGMGALDPARAGGGWLTPAVREQYRAVWSGGLTGACNYYRASPLRPPTAHDDGVLRLVLAPDAVSVRVPTRVVWAEDDTALLPALVEGLHAYVPDLTLVRVPGATHWIVHERPERICAEIELSLAC